jgi:hypothetical protein
VEVALRRWHDVRIVHEHGTRKIVVTPYTVLHKTAGQDHPSWPCEKKEHGQNESIICFLAWSIQKTFGPCRYSLHSFDPCTRSIHIALASSHRRTYQVVES